MNKTRSESCFTAYWLDRQSLWTLFGPNRSELHLILHSFLKGTMFTTPNCLFVALCVVVTNCINEISLSVSEVRSQPEDAQPSGLCTLTTHKFSCCLLLRLITLHHDFCFLKVFMVNFLLFLHLTLLKVVKWISNMMCQYHLNQD